LKKQIAKVYCSISELYMTDLCFEQDAEERCEEAIASSLATVPDGVDGKQALANLRLSQCRLDEASNLIEDVFHCIRVIREKQHARTVVEELAGAPEPDCVQG
jgi:hypothetical protein